MVRVGVFLPNWVGDVVMATPALRAITRQLGSDCQIYGVMRPYVAEVLAGTPWLHETIYFDPKSDDPQQRSWAVVRRLRNLRLDIIISLTNSLRAGVICWGSGAKRRLGYARNGRRMFLTEVLIPPRDKQGWKPISAVDYYLELVALLGCEITDREVELSTTSSDEQLADRVWRQQGWSKREPVVAICPAGAYGAAKHWPVASFAELARRLRQEHDVSVLILSGPAEREMARQIQTQANDPRVVAVLDLPPTIGLSKACLQRCEAVITTDSGPRHLAAGFGVPTVALFGPTDPAWSLNYSPVEIRLQQDQLACLPCRQRVCPLQHHRCMTELTVDRVLQAVWQLPSRRSLLTQRSA
jgi:heptosyltransferase-2